MPKKKRPAKPSKSRKPRERINWTPWLWAAVVINVTVGVLFSPITSPVKVRAIGLPQEYREEAQQVIARWQDQPSAQVNKEAVGSALLRISAIETATVRMNILGRGVITVKMKSPAAKLMGSKNALASDGSIAYFAKLPPDLPSLSLRKEFLEPEPALTPGWEAWQVALFCQEIRKSLPKQPWKLDADLRGVLHLRTGDKKGVVIFGTPTRIKEKVEAAKSAFAKEPDLLDKYSELNVTAPDQVMVKP